jgi:hypothetical protein
MPLQPDKLSLTGPPEGISSDPNPLAQFEAANGPGVAFAASDRMGAAVLVVWPATAALVEEVADRKLGLAAGVLHADKKSLSAKPRPWAALEGAAEDTAGASSTASSQLAPVTAPSALVVVLLAL